MNTDVNQLCMGCMRTKAVGEEKCPHCGFHAETYKKDEDALPLYTILAGKYLTGKMLGKGGFGITYIGWDLNLGMRIAIKEYYPQNAILARKSDECSVTYKKENLYQKGLESYAKEAKTLSMLPYKRDIVQVKDFFYENETAYIVMEYVEGITLKSYLKDEETENSGKTMDGVSVLRMIHPIFEPLSYIHEAGVIHRDISPDNLMITPEQKIVLIDFGSARYVNAEEDNKTMSILLKRGYSPMEQYASHGKQGAWTDIYSLCATIYRMAVGKRPLEALDRINDPYSAEKIAGELAGKFDPEVARAIVKGLEPKVENRYQSLKELEEAIYKGRPWLITAQANTDPTPDPIPKQEMDAEPEPEVKSESYSAPQSQVEKKEVSKSNDSLMKWIIFFVVLDIIGALALAFEYHEYSKLIGEVRRVQEAYVCMEDSICEEEVEYLG